VCHHGDLIDYSLRYVERIDGLSKKKGKIKQRIGNNGKDKGKKNAGKGWKKIISLRIAFKGSNKRQMI
jgi:hypothetical protein